MCAVVYSKWNNFLTPNNSDKQEKKVHKIWKENVYKKKTYALFLSHTKLYNFKFELGKTTREWSETYEMTPAQLADNFSVLFSQSQFNFNISLVKGWIKYS